MKRALLIGASIVGLSLLFVVSLGGAAALHVHSTLGRRALADAIEMFVGSEIRGSLAIGRIDEAGADRVVAHDVTFRSPDGDDTLHIDEVTLDPAITRLFTERTIGATSGRADGVELTMRDGRDGLTLEETFDSASPPAPEGSSSGPTFFIDFERISFEHLSSRWQLDGAPSFRIDRASGIMRARTDEHGDPIVRFDRVDGRFATTGLPIELSAGIRRSSGRVHANWERMGSFDIQLDIAGSDLELDLDLYDRDGGLEVRTETEAAGPSLAWLVALGVDVASPDVPRSRGEMRGGKAGNPDAPSTPTAR